MLDITWSLAVEEQFYLVAPAVVKYLRSVLPIVLLIAYVAVCIPALGGSPSLVLPGFFRETTFAPINERINCHGVNGTVIGKRSTQSAPVLVKMDNGFTLKLNAHTLSVELPEKSRISHQMP
jgi:hypothetical protein